MKNKKKSLHHSTHRLARIRKKIENHGYDQLSENDLLFISNEIESKHIPLEEVQTWMNSKRSWYKKTNIRMNIGFWIS